MNNKASLLLRNKASLLLRNKILLAALSMIILIGGIYWFTKPTTSIPSSTPISSVSTKDQKVDYQAGFAIFTNGTFRVFTAKMYHNLSQDVYIQADNPNIVHVKKKGTTWDDFFKTLPFKLTKDCLITGTKETFCNTKIKSLKFYLNGIKTDNLLDREIKSEDKVLITYGNETEEQIQNQLQKVPIP